MVLVETHEFVVRYALMTCFGVAYYSKVGIILYTNSTNLNLRITVATMDEGKKNK